MLEHVFNVEQCLILLSRRSLPRIKESRKGNDRNYGNKACMQLSSTHSENVLEQNNNKRCITAHFSSTFLASFILRLVWNWSRIERIILKNFAVMLWTVASSHCLLSHYCLLGVRWHDTTTTTRNMFVQLDLMFVFGAFFVFVNQGFD